MIEFEFKPESGGFIECKAPDTSEGEHRVSDSEAFRAFEKLKRDLPRHRARLSLEVGMPLNLIKMSLPNHDLGDRAVRALVEALVRGTVHTGTIELYKNRLGDASAQALAQLIMLSPYPGLFGLHLSHNFFTPVGVSLMLKATAACGRYPMRRCGTWAPLWLRVEHQLCPWPSLTGERPPEQLRRVEALLAQKEETLKECCQANGRWPTGDAAANFRLICMPKIQETTTPSDDNFSCERRPMCTSSRCIHACEYGPIVHLPYFAFQNGTNYNPPEASTLASKEADWRNWAPRLPIGLRRPIADSSGQQDETQRENEKKDDAEQAENTYGEWPNLGMPISASLGKAESSMSKVACTTSPTSRTTSSSSTSLPQPLPQPSQTKVSETQNAVDKKAAPRQADQADRSTAGKTKDRASELQSKQVLQTVGGAKKQRAQKVPQTSTRKEKADEELSLWDIAVADVASGKTRTDRNAKDSGSDEEDSNSDADSSVEEHEDKGKKDKRESTASKHIEKMTEELFPPSLDRTTNGNNEFASSNNRKSSGEATCTSAPSKERAKPGAHGASSNGTSASSSQSGPPPTLTTSAMTRPKAVVAEKKRLDEKQSSGAKACTPKLEKSTSSRAPALRKSGTMSSAAASSMKTQDAGAKRVSLTASPGGVFTKRLKPDVVATAAAMDLDESD